MVAYDQEIDLEFEVTFACACDATTFMLSEDCFGCVHCDSVCVKQNCEQCKSLMEKDFGKNDA